MTDNLCPNLYIHQLLGVELEVGAFLQFLPFLQNLKDTLILRDYRPMGRPHIQCTLSVCYKLERMYKLITKQMKIIQCIHIIA